MNLYLIYYFLKIKSVHQCKILILIFFSFFHKNSINYIGQIKKKPYFFYLYSKNIALGLFSIELEHINLHLILHIYTER